MEPLMVSITGLKPNTSYKIIETSVDEENNNTYSAWEKMGRPSSSINLDLGPFKNVGILSPTNAGRLSTNNKGILNLKLFLENHSMKLVQINEE